VNIIHTDAERREDYRVGDQVVTRKGRVSSVLRVQKTADGTMLVTVRVAYDYYEVYSSLPDRHAGYPLCKLRRAHSSVTHYYRRDF